MYDMEYFVNEDKGVVVCKLYDTAETLVNEMARRGLVPANECTFYSSLLSDTYTGKARCAEGDTFDLEKGKRIAYKRAMAKLNRAKEKVILRAMREQERYQKHFYKVTEILLKKCQTAAINAEQDVLKIISGEAKVGNATDVSGGEA